MFTIIPNDHERISMKKIIFAVPAIALMVILSGCGERAKPTVKKSPRTVKKVPAKRESRSMRYAK